MYPYLSAVGQSSNNSWGSFICCQHLALILGHRGEINARYPCTEVMTSLTIIWVSTQRASIFRHFCDSLTTIPDSVGNQRALPDGNNKWAVEPGQSPVLVVLLCTHQRCFCVRKDLGGKLNSISDRRHPAVQRKLLPSNACAERYCTQHHLSYPARSERSPRSSVEVGEERWSPRIFSRKQSSLHRQLAESNSGLDG